MVRKYATPEQEAAAAELERQYRDGEIAVDEFIERISQIPGSLWYEIEALSEAVAAKRIELEQQFSPK